MNEREAASAEPSGQMVVERPPPGLARGPYAWPAWAIAAAGVLVCVVAMAYLWRRWRKARA